MASSVIYPFGGQIAVSVPAGSSLAITTRDKATVLQAGSYPNVPPSEAVLGYVLNGETRVFGPFSSATSLLIDGGADEVLYTVGVSPVIVETLSAPLQPTPVAVNVTGAVTAAAIFGGIVTSTTAAAVAGTVPTGTVMDQAVANMPIGQSFDWSVIATGANAFTVTAAAGHTLVGTAVVATLTTGRFRTVKTAAATFVTYRIA